MLIVDQDRVYQSVFPRKSATHGGDDVPIFASGPMSHLFTGVHEQTFIAHGMAYAACIGWDKSHCETVNSGVSLTVSSFMYQTVTSIVLLLIVV